MFLIKEKKNLTPTVIKMIIDAPFVIKHAKVGQFVMIRINNQGERIPLTIAEKDIIKGTLVSSFRL